MTTMIKITLTWSCFLLILIAVGGVSAASSSSWNQNFNIVWGKQHARGNDQQPLQMLLDRSSGSAFQSFHRYMFGFISVTLKLVPNDSAGVVTTLYLSSTTNNHDELDLEFLGNRTGQPYTLHTNIYVDGVGDREIRFKLWFDPSKDYHTYSFLWNRHQIVFFVDSVPIRVLRNTVATIFPSQPMYVYGSIWDASDWATRGGLDKIDWNSAPFISNFGSYQLDSCPWEDPFPQCITSTWQHWWDQPQAWTLSPSQRSSYLWVQNNYVIYDYCQDRKRYPLPPKECYLSPW